MGLRWGLMWHFGIHKKLLKIVQVKHHDAHAAIFFASPFEEAAVLVMDGHGDETAQSAYIGSGNRLQRLWQSEVFDSLGFLYTAATAYLGFKPFAEGTVMALAGTGRPTYANQFRELVRLGARGTIFDQSGLDQLRHPRRQEAVQGMVHGGVRSAAPTGRAHQRSSSRSCLRASVDYRRRRCCTSSAHSPSVTLPAISA